MSKVLVMVDWAHSHVSPTWPQPLMDAMPELWRLGVPRRLKRRVSEIIYRACMSPFHGLRSIRNKNVRPLAKSDIVVHGVGHFPGHSSSLFIFHSVKQALFSNLHGYIRRKWGKEKKNIITKKERGKSIQSIYTEGHSSGIHLNKHVDNREWFDYERFFTNT